MHLHRCSIKLAVGIVEAPAHSYCYPRSCLNRCSVYCTTSAAVLPQKIRIQIKARTSAHSHSHPLNLVHIPKGFTKPGLKFARLYIGILAVPSAAHSLPNCPKPQIPVWLSYRKETTSFLATLEFTTGCLAPLPRSLQPSRSIIDLSAA